VSKTKLKKGQTLSPVRNVNAKTSHHYQEIQFI